MGYLPNWNSLDEWVKVPNVSFDRLIIVHIELNREREREVKYDEYLFIRKMPLTC